MKDTSSNWYDYPQYFDMVFRDETAAEVNFFEKAFLKFADRKVQRLLEPGCGSGRLIAAMASRGYDCAGVDLSQTMLTYLERRLKRRGLKANLVLGDMTSMEIPGPTGKSTSSNQASFDAAFCTFNTFRHLLSDHDALNHLQSVARHLKPGGIYLLGFHIIPLDADAESIERWRASHGGTNVHVTLKVIDFNRKKRQEQIRVSIKAVKKSGKVERIRSEFPLRLYTVPQVKKLLQQVEGLFELIEAFDFDYDIHGPRKIDDDLTDALFVLKRTSHQSRLGSLGK